MSIAPKYVIAPEALNQFPIDYLEIAKQALEFIQANHSNGSLVDKQFGICSALSDQIARISNRKDLVLWAYKLVGRSCESSAPIKSPTYNRQSIASWGQELWSGEQLENRLILIAELIAAIDSILTAEKNQ